MRYLQICLAIFTTGFIVSCKSPYFTSVNDMRQINGIIYLKDGKEITGPLSSSLQNFGGTESYIRFTDQNGKEGQKIYIKDIKGISVRNNYYEPKLIDMGFASRDKMLFVKRLTRPGMRIGLYELYEQQTNSNSRGQTYNTNSYTYYVSFPGHPEYEAWNVDGKHLTPNFEDKMSEQVKDCPTLAEKIRQNEKGYFYAQISFASEKRIETIMNIADEYEKCK